MLNVTLGRQGHELKTLLCLGAHCDDIEIGCGGTILRLTREHPQLRVHWVVFSSDPRRAAEARCSADAFLENAGGHDVQIKEFRNGYFPSVVADIKDSFEELKAAIRPDLIFTHYRNDLHQDHRVISELTWNTFRNHLVLEYEIPKYDGDLGTPNLFVPLPENIWSRKVETLMQCFTSQRDKHWFTPDTFAGLMRLRGVESNSNSGYAEAFYCRKVVLG
jgi:LmbE family N-acetylglucosaminyl deacetylase